MKLFGLVGFPLSHSWSANHFNEKFVRLGIHDATYRAFPLEHIQGLLPMIRTHKDLSGFNVTIPHKVSVLSLLNETDPIALAIGAVNAVKVQRREEKVYLKGYNTDAEGFLKSLPEPLNHQKALILGSGGASRAVRWALEQIGVTSLIVSRNPSNPNQIGYNDLTSQVLKEYTMMVNTTPLGMFPDTESTPPIPWKSISERHFMYDLIYNPDETLFLKMAKSRAAMTMNGYSMLIKQAEASWRIFFDGQG